MIDAEERIILEKLGFARLGWAIKEHEDSTKVKRPLVHERWYDKERSATPAKIYVSWKVASRYGYPVEVFGKLGE